MPNSKELVTRFNTKNIYEIDYDYLRSRIERVLNRTERKDLDNALKTTVAKIFLEEAIDYSIFRRKNVYSAFNGKLDPISAEQAMQASNETGFLFGYMEIATACAKEYLPNYQPKFMFGMTQDETKAHIDKMFGCYTRFDEARHDLINVNGIEDAMEDIENARVDLQGNVRDYAKESSITQGQIRELYMRQEVLKGELKKMWFWQRWFSSAAKEMKTYIQAAQKALKDVNFTEQDAKEAQAEFKDPAARKDDIKVAHEKISDFYEKGIAAETKNRMFEIDYRPNRAKMNDHIKYANEIRAVLKEGKGNISPEAKEVFEMNYEKIKLIANAMKGKGITAPEAVDRCREMEAEMAKKLTNYTLPSIEDLGIATLRTVLLGSQKDNLIEPTNEPANEPVKEAVKIDLNEKTSTIAEPVKEPEKNLNIEAKTK